MGKFLLMAEHEIQKPQFNFQIAQPGNKREAGKVFCIVDTNSNQAHMFALFDGLEEYCNQMNRVQSWGLFNHAELREYVLV